MKKEIERYNYLPNNFMFIFPILSKNYLANRLEAKIQEFWINKFADENYQSNVLINNKYYKDKIKDNKYYKYVVLHKSDEGKSIDLRESENATRILSIHASKGNGCEVVFLLGLTQQTLEIFSKTKCNLQYDSLLHVALTRQKKALYIGLENKCDDISKRFNNYNIKINNDIKPNLNDIKISNKYNKIIDYVLNINPLFSKIYDKYYTDDNVIKIQKKINESTNLQNDKKNIIDWGHHLIRYCVFYYQLLYNIMNTEKMNDNNKDTKFKNQYITILNYISKFRIQLNNHNEYYKNINIKNKDKFDKNIFENNIFPILSFNDNSRTKYYRYTEILKKFMLKIQVKIKDGIDKNKLPLLCPLETIILLHMMRLFKNGQYSDITIMDIYTILYYFDECSSSIDASHKERYNCLCYENFTDNNNNDNNNKFLDIRNSIINHYKTTEQIDVLYQNYKQYILDNLGDSCDFNYNINHPITLYNEHNNIKSSDNYEIIAISDKYIIDFIITPQFNKLNFNKIILQAIFNNFLLQNSCKDHKNNYERYNNKVVYTCILTLDFKEPIFIKFNIEKSCKILRESIGNFFSKKYSDKHKIIYNYYQYCKNNTKDDNPIKFTYNEILRENKMRSGLGVSNIPKYIEDYFYDKTKEIKKCKDKNKINDILTELNDSEIFLEDIYGYLEESIDEFIENNDDELCD